MTQTADAPAVRQLADRVGLTDLRAGVTFRACRPDAKVRRFVTYRVTRVFQNGTVAAVNATSNKERNFTRHQLADCREYGA